MKPFPATTLPFTFIGPDLSIKAKTVLYFALSDKDTLETPPLSYPAKLLASQGYRVLSTTLPFHENDAKPSDIKTIWGSSSDRIESFLDALTATIEDILPFCSGPLAAMGLSRGAFIAAHLTARVPAIETLLGFSPLSHLHEVSHLDLDHLKEALKEKRIRFYIGHNDKRVGTERIISLISSYIECATAAKIRTPDIDLVIKPSAGFQGHGTLDPVFDEGVSWLRQYL